MIENGLLDFDKFLEEFQVNPYRAMRRFMIHQYEVQVDNLISLMEWMKNETLRSR